MYCKHFWKCYIKLNGILKLCRLGFTLNCVRSISCIIQLRLSRTKCFEFKTTQICVKKPYYLFMRYVLFVSRLCRRWNWLYVHIYVVLTFALSSLTLSTAFDIFILATIIANCVVLALDAPLPNNDKSSISDELVSTIVYLEFNDRFCIILARLQCVMRKFRVTWPCMTASQTQRRFSLAGSLTESNESGDKNKSSLSCNICNLS